MSKYFIVQRVENSPMLHAGGTTEETVCKIAKHLLNHPWPSDFLMAVPAENKMASFAIIKDDVLCSIEVTKRTLDIWRDDVSNIQEAIEGFVQAKDRAEMLLDRALSELDDAYNASEEFGGYVPSNEIGVYSALEELGAGDLEYAFDRALREMYKFNAYQRQSA